MKKWSFDSDARARLMSLMNECSPAGDETAVAAYVRRELDLPGCSTVTDVLGNIYGRLNKDSEYNVALVAHMDTVCVQVVKILDSGLLLFRRIGVQLMPLAGARIRVLSAEGSIRGIVGYDPLTRSDSAENIADNDLWIDIGAGSGTEAEQFVQVGDLAVFEPHCSMLGKYGICGAGLDNRIGLFAAIEVIRLLATLDLRVGVSLLGTVQEEAGLRGVQVSGGNMKMDCALVMDVDFASDMPTGSDKTVGTLNLGGGAGISRKLTCNRELQKIIMAAARQADIPCQVNAGRNFIGGTDADRLQLQSSGVATANIAIPCRYMHSANELCDLRDVEHVVNLLVDTVVAIDKRGGGRFIPGVEDE